MKLLSHSKTRVIAFDHFLFHWIFRLHGHSLLDRVMKIITRIGDGFVWPILCVGMLFYDWQAGMFVLRTGLLAFAIELPIFRWIKVKTSRARPYKAFPDVINLARPQEPYSFPSGHTAGAFIFAYCAGEAFPLLFYPLLLLGWLIGISRVYVGVHYPLDVIVGGLGGILSAMTAIEILH
ncbi:phosphatase PAP2 family protein [candidate division KSB1 bacterium]|nr:phosphatase PAP2 family protein [candidate division KSB1 bacterium]